MRKKIAQPISHIRHPRAGGGPLSRWFSWIPAFAGMTALLLLPPALAAETAPKWNVMHSQSSIAFRPKQMGTEFRGTFDLFAADIAFDPANLEGSRVLVEIHVSKVSTGASDRDEALRSGDWFDVTKYPTARFEAARFRKTGDDTFEAEGTLTIKDITQPVVLPFRLSIVKDDSGKRTATVDGSLVLDRSLYRLGTGQWADKTIVANEVPVDIHIVALPANLD
jgi:polyisoprenoid-binding protein YceI